MRAQTLGCRADSAHQSAAWAHAGAWHCAAGATQARAVFAGDIGGRAQRSWTALRRLIEDVREEWRSIDQRIKGYNDELAERVHNEEAAKRLTRIPGIGVLTATALVAAVGNAQTFSCGRDLAAWLGLVPRQATTGGKPRLLHISKRGNGYLRMLLIHGARTALPGLAKKDTPLGRWVKALLARAHRNVDRSAGQQACADCLGGARTRPPVCHRSSYRQMKGREA